MLTFGAENAVLPERVILSAILALFGMTVLFGPGNPARARAVKAPNTFSSWDGEGDAAEDRTGRGVGRRGRDRRAVVLTRLALPTREHRLVPLDRGSQVGD